MHLDWDVFFLIKYTQCSYFTDSFKYSFYYLRTFTKSGQNKKKKLQNLASKLLEKNWGVSELMRVASCFTFSGHDQWSRDITVRARRKLLTVNQLRSLYCSFNGWTVTRSVFTCMESTTTVIMNIGYIKNYSKLFSIPGQQFRVCL